MRRAVSVCILCRTRPARSQREPVCKRCAPRPSVHKNKPVHDAEDGWFQSTGEHARWKQLRQWEALGLIENLTRQVKHQLTVNGRDVTSYIADAEYDVLNVPGLRTGSHVIEDFKGRTSGHAFELFKLKVAILRAVEGMEVTVVTSRDVR